MFKLFSNKLTCVCALALLCLAFGGGQAFAQSTVTGGIRGTVTDPQKAVIPNVTVTVTRTATNQAQTVNADSNGVFVVNNLQPGTYSVSISQSGFAAYTAEGIIVEVGQVTTVSPELGLTGQTAQVTVTAEAPVINTDSQDFSTNVNQTQINELPINGRRASNFVLLTPATVPDGSFGLVSFRGISGLLNNSTVDGGDNNQAFFSEERGRTRINYSISQSAVREFQVNGANYSAEYGRAAGGVINTVTKSGTNEFRGEVFYYNRNNRNGARNPLAFQSVLVNGVAQRFAAKPIDLRQQFGGALGGPIIKDRLFFFFSYDQQKRNFPGLSTYSNATFLNGFDAAGNNRATLIGRGLTNAQIDSTLGFINSLTGETPRRGDQTLYLPKIDWQINNNNLFNVTYNRLRWKSPAGIQTQAVNNLGRRSFGDDFVKVDSLNLRLQSTLTTNILNEARFQYGRDFEYQNSQQPLPGEPITANTSFGPRAPNVNLGGNGLAFGTPTFLERPSYPDERRIQFADTLTVNRGRHTFKFGLDINRVSDDTQNLRFEAGSFAYNNSVTDFIIDYLYSQRAIAATTLCATQITNTAGRTIPTGYAVNATGQAIRTAGYCYNGNFSQGVGVRGIKFNTFDYNFFAQDNFRITPRLTINLGLRYEYEKLPSATLANNTLYKDRLIPNTNLTFAQATSQLPSDKNNFGPRVGFAYDLTGDGKTSLRGGYGIYYGRIVNSTIYNALINTGNPGGQAQIDTPVTITVLAANATNSSQTVTVQNPNAAVFPNVPSATINANATTPLGAIQYFRPDFQAPLINQYDLIVERQLTKNTAVSVSYVGSLGRSLPTFIDRNFRTDNVQTRSFRIVGGPLDGQTFQGPLYSRDTTNYGSQAITEITSSVNSEYNALVVQANRRFTSGLQFQASYTFAKATDTGQSSTTFTANNTPVNVFDASYDAGPSRFDVRHKFVVSAIYAPIIYKGSTNSIYNYLLNGYQIAPVYTVYSGQPYNGTVGGIGNGLNGTNGDNRLFILPRNSFRLPRISNFDLRLSKRFRFTERYNLEFLAEGFNIFNRTNTFAVNTQLYSGTTANVTNAAGLGACSQGTTASNLTPVLCYNTTNGIANFGATTTADSTNYRERQIQFAVRFQF